jgi:hypothetical protein
LSSLLPPPPPPLLLLLLLLLPQLDLTASQLLEVLTIRLPDTAAGQPAKAARRPRRCHVTPPELVLLPPRSTLAAAKQAVTEAFAEMYRLAVGWKCEQLHGLPQEALLLPAPGEAGSSSAAETAAAAAAADNKAIACSHEGSEPEERRDDCDGGGGCGGYDADGCVLLGEVLRPGLVVTAVGSGLDPEPR